MLERCPLCGKEAVENIDFKLAEMEIDIHCPACGCGIQDSFSTEKKFAKSNDLINFILEVEGKWNKRTTPTS